MQLLQEFVDSTVYCLKIYHPPCKQYFRV